MAPPYANCCWLGPGPFKVFTRPAPVVVVRVNVGLLRLGDRIIAREQALALEVLSDMCAAGVFLCVRY